MQNRVYQAWIFQQLFVLEVIYSNQVDQNDRPIFEWKITDLSQGKVRILEPENL